MYCSPARKFQIQYERLNTITDITVAPFLPRTLLAVLDFEYTNDDRSSQTVADNADQRCEWVKWGCGQFLPLISYTMHIRVVVVIIIIRAMIRRRRGDWLGVQKGKKGWAREGYTCSMNHLQPAVTSCMFCYGPHVVFLCSRFWHKSYHRFDLPSSNRTRIRYK